MTWFKVDDSFHSHPKTLATNPAALGLWVVAGSWSSAHLTEGFVRDGILQRLLPDSETLARELVAAGLWKRVRGGYQFHDWLDRNPDKEAVTQERKSNAERQRRWREAQRNAVTDAVTNAVTNGAPTRPDPTIKKGIAPSASYEPTSGAEPPRRCAEHTGTLNPPPCGPCAEARKAFDAWHVAKTKRVNGAPKCRVHIGELAHNCRACASERKAGMT